MTKFCTQMFSSHPSKQTIVKKCRTEAGKKPKFADLLPTCLFFRSASSYRPDFSLIQRPAFLSIINSNRYSNQSEPSVTQLPENSKCLVFGQAVFQASLLVPANTACYAGYYTEEFCTDFCNYKNFCAGN